MADPKKWTAWTPGGPINDADQVPGMQAGDNVIWDWSQAWDYISAKLSATLAALAPKASPAFTGNPTAPTPTAGDNDTSIATTAFVQGEIAPLAPKASPALTGVPTAPTAARGTHTGQVATTEFVQRAGWNLIDMSAVPAPVTGTTTETTLAAIAIPAGAMGPNGRLRVTTVWSATNNANVKAGRGRLGNATSGPQFMTASFASQASLLVRRELANRNSQTSQVGFVAGTTASDGLSTSTLFAGTQDTSVAWTLYLTGALANAADTLTLEAWSVEVLYGA